MTDPYATLHGPRRTAPPGGAERAIAAGRRRIVRRRTATTAGVSAAVVAGAALTSAAPRGTSDGLRPAAPVPLATATGRADATAAPGAAETPLPTPALASGVPTPTPLFVGSAAPTPPSGSEASPDPAATAAPGSRWIGTTPGEIDIKQTNDPTACAGAGSPGYTASSGFCTILTGPEQVVTGRPVSLSLVLCRPAGLPERTVTFDSGYEVVLDVVKDGPGGDVRQWAWAQPEDFPRDRHVVTFKPGDCRTWTVRWAGQGDDGYALAPGYYQVNGYPFAYDWTHEDGADAQGPVPQFYTVEVTR